MKNPPSEGVCQLCQGKFAKNTITRHLHRCLAEHDLPEGKEQKLFHLLVDGYGPYWLHVEMPGQATFGNLDSFLRHIWLECCGHLSAFQLDQGIKNRLGLKEDWDMDFAEAPKDELMDYELAEVLEPKLAFGYEYDFGSTTSLRLKVAGVRSGKWAAKERVRLLARNLPPEVACDACGKPAKWIDTENDVFQCAACARKGDDDYLLPVVNSPRMGVCAYTGT